MIRILVIEDEEYARKSMCKQLRELSEGREMELLEASNGKQGIEICRETKPDLILSDIRMPLMDGLTVLKNIREIHPEAKVIMVSAYADFEYAKTSLDYGADGYLLKPISDEDMGKALRKFFHQNRQKKANEFSSGKDMITRYIMSCIQEENHQDLIARNMFRKIFGRYQLLVIWHQKHNYPDMEEFLKGLYEILGDEIWTRVRLLELRKDMWVFLTEADGESSFQYRRIEKIFAAHGWDCRIGISEVLETPEEIHKGYEQALTAVESKIFFDEGLLFYGNIRKDSSAEYQMTETERAFLKACLKEKSPGKTRRILEKIFENLERSGTVSTGSLKILLSQLSVLLHRENEPPFRFNILEYASLDELKKQVFSMAEKICLKEGGGERDIIREMKEYADLHYSKEVSVKYLAEQVFFMNPDYLSHLFAEKTGESYSSYLKKVRMERARELLKEERFSITEIGTMAGYNDSSRFIRIFKEYTGMTPKKYRAGILEEKKK